MENKKYIIKYTQDFINQLNDIIDYLNYQLYTSASVNNFSDEVFNAIEKRSMNPLSFEKYKSRKKRKWIYYRIYVRNYTVFYTVNDNIMEIRLILYSRRNINKII